MSRRHSQDGHDGLVHFTDSRRFPLYGSQPMRSRNRRALRLEPPEDRRFFLSITVESLEDGIGIPGKFVILRGGLTCIAFLLCLSSVF